MKTLKEWPQFQTLNPDTEYWLGFILADGCIHHSKKRGKTYKVLKLTSKDREHLEKFVIFMGVPGKGITPRKHPHGSVTYQVDFTSNQLCESLERWCILPQKSLTAKVHPELKDSLHFWRGVYDVDGSLSARRRTFKKGETTSLVFCMLGTEDVISNFREFSNRWGLRSKGAIENKYGLQYIRYSSNDAQTLLNALYSEGGTRLDRKYEKYKSLLHERESQNLLTTYPNA